MRKSVALFGPFVLALAVEVHAQTDWPLQVRDLATGQGIAGAVVEGRTSRVTGVTDASGNVTLTVGEAVESVVVHGHSGYNYQVGDYTVDGPRVIYLVPDAMFHKTPLIPVTGTVAPFVFQGSTQTPFGPNPYTIEVEVPAGVLPEAVSFWIVPVPAFASPSPSGADTIINLAMGQFAIELHDINGKEITPALPDPGVVVRVSPTWYTYAHIAQHANVVQGTQYRLTKTAGQWSSQSDNLSWDPATGMFTAHLRACSWWVILLPLPFLAGDTWQGGGSSSPTDPPPSPAVKITKADCVTSSGLGAQMVRCGIVQDGPNTATVGSNGTVTFNAQFMAGLTASLGIAPSSLARLITRITAQASGSLQLEASGGVTFTGTGSMSSTIPVGANYGYPCYSGEIRMAVAERGYKLEIGANSIDWKLPEGIIKVLCLTLDQSCGENCQYGSPIQKVLPSSLKVCTGDPLNCQ